MAHSNGWTTLSVEMHAKKRISNCSYVMKAIQPSKKLAFGSWDMVSPIPSDFSAKVSRLHPHLEAPTSLLGYCLQKKRNHSKCNGFALAGMVPCASAWFHASVITSGEKTKWALKARMFPLGTFIDAAAIDCTASGVVLMTKICYCVDARSKCGTVWEQASEIQMQQAIQRTVNNWQCSYRSVANHPLPFALLQSLGSHQVTV